jgi:hypothetical protein
MPLLVMPILSLQCPLNTLLSVSGCKDRSPGRTVTS